MLDDRRLATRRRTRLRAGKLYTYEGRFVADCRVLDRTSLGARIMLADAVRVPYQLWLYDDEQNLLFDVDLMWRRAATCGLRFVSRPRASNRIKAAFGGQFYALGASPRAAQA